MGIDDRFNKNIEQDNKPQSAGKSGTESGSGDKPAAPAVRAPAPSPVPRGPAPPTPRGMGPMVVPQHPPGMAAPPKKPSAPPQPLTEKPDDNEH